MLPSAIRRWLHRPKKSDPRLLAKFFHVDEEVSNVVREMHCMDALHDPGHYLILLNQLHSTQARMLALLEQMLEQIVPKKRRRRDYHWKFTDESLPGHMTPTLLFAAELMVGGTYVEVDEANGATIRPLAKELVRGVMEVRYVLREQSLEDPGIYPERAQRALLQYDYLCAEFEFRYMSLLLSPVKTPEEVYEQQEVAVLFCETVYRALQKGYITQDMIDGYEPELMISIPRLGIISGLLIYPDGPLNLQKGPEEICELFSPFYDLLKKIKELLFTLTEDELHSLEKVLCSSKDSPEQSTQPESNVLSSQSHCKETEPELSSVKLTRNPKSSMANSQIYSSPVSSDTNTCQSGDADVEQVNPNTWDSSTISDPENKLSENTTHVRNSASIVHCAIKRTTDHRNPHARKSRCVDARSRYPSDREMLHRLFVCISGVADQLQTNYAGELRLILKSVFEAVHSKQDHEESTPEDALHLPDCTLCQDHQNRRSDPVPPEWVPDSACTQCTTCCAPFTLLRRRHHCRSCGKIFCSRCSEYTAFLSNQHGLHPVRVCSHCYHVHCCAQGRSEEGAQGST